MNKEVKTRGKNISKPSLEEKYYNKVIGTRIELYRNNKNMTQNELAKLIDVSRVTITQIEAGRSMVSIYKLIRISKALDISYVKILKSIV
ncbi:hypothetical protein LCGC14_1989480 [marine sediment metagenome]|uniref:HTH cro/C1-type domain-containing protein n=1 Tax=marine sediment metagenome TaxID=412755 RepID=A0A0F9F6A8_9ZZZZ|nr:XRE family transcriptional regulator [bacterium]